MKGSKIGICVVYSCRLKLFIIRPAGNDRKYEALVRPKIRWVLRDLTPSPARLSQDSNLGSLSQCPLLYRCLVSQREVERGEQEHKERGVETEREREIEGGRQTEKGGR